MNIGVAEQPVWNEYVKVRCYLLIDIQNLMKFARNTHLQKHMYTRDFHCTILWLHLCQALQQAPMYTVHQKAHVEQQVRRYCTELMLRLLTLTD
jgi:hypothetical protein